MPPWGNGELIRWFSEYEFIGNWIMSRRPITQEFQRRYHYDNMEKIDGFDYNVVTKAIENANLKKVVSNSFGFGGNGVSLVFEKYN